MGILVDHPYRVPKRASAGLARLEGGPVRKRSTKTRGTVAEVGEKIRKQHRVPYLTKPFQSESSAQMKAVNREIGNLLTGKAKSYSKLETALRALIRVPILKLKYGRNTPEAERTKGFNRKLFDTGQFYRAIIAKVKVHRVQKRP